MLFLSEKYAWKLRKMKYEQNMLIKKLNIIISDLPLSQQFALMGVKLQCLVAKHVMSGTLFIFCLVSTLRCNQR